MNGRVLIPEEDAASAPPAADRPNRPPVAIPHLLLLAGGLAILAGLGWRIGPENIFFHLQPLGWTVLLAFPSYLLVFVLDALGWRYAFDRPVSVGLPRLTALQVIGKAVNLVTPLAPIGGEPLKAYLLRSEGLALAEGLASVVISRTVATIAQGLFVVVFTGFALLRLELPVPLLRAMLGALLAGVVLVGALLLAQARGLFASVLAFLRRVGLGLSFPEGEARDVDRRISGYYRHHSGRFLLALAFYFLGWVAEALEVYVLLALLDLPRSPALALALVAFSSAIRAASFVVPGSLGIQEGGNVLLFASLGVPPDAAMAFSILRRLRELAWSAAGFFLLSWYGRGQQAPHAEAAPAAP